MFYLMQTQGLVGNRTPNQLEQIFCHKVRMIFAGAPAITTFPVSKECVTTAFAPTIV